jgi:hypothetical protein
MRASVAIGGEVDKEFNIKCFFNLINYYYIINGWRCLGKRREKANY